MRVLEILGMMDRRQVRCLQRLGNGRAVSVTVPRGDPVALELRFEHKIGKDDVTAGKLKPLALQIAKRRGGKRSVSILVTYESAEALHAELGKALKKLRRRRIGEVFMTTLFETTLAWSRYPPTTLPLNIEKAS